MTGNTRTAMNNPFTPMFGRVPPYLAGRELLIDDMAHAFECGASDPNLCSIFVGTRGSGKTALITHLAQRAQSMGWITAEVTAGEGMLSDILQRLNESAAHLSDRSASKTLTGISMGSLGGLTWESADSEPANWRTRMNDLFEQLGRTDTGILISVDEVDPSIEELVHLVTTFQHFVREGKKCSLLMAGLPHKVSSLLSGSSTSFLRRAARHDLGLIPDYDVEEAFSLTIETAGKIIGTAALDKAARSIKGFPYMFQLVGYRAWRASGNSAEINAEHVAKGAAIALKELKSRVFDVTWRELSRNDTAFLKAMAQLGDSCTRAELMEALGKPTSHISTYKRRLLDAGVIEEPMPSTFRFALPGFGDYVKETVQ